MSPNQTSSETDPATPLERLHLAAERSGLICLAQKWRGPAARYMLRCKAANHEFMRLGVRILTGEPACPDCQREEFLARIKAQAHEKGGDCLETAYLGDKPHRFICAHGHEWQTRPLIVLRGHWCRKCHSLEIKQRQMLKDGLARLQALALAKGGVCLSEAYLGTNRYHRFRCAEGHEWETQGAGIVNGGWCPQCAAVLSGQKRRLSDGLQRLQAMAGKRGGECLSQAYTGVMASYRFRCAAGHEWETEGSYILEGSWCRECSFQDLAQRMLRTDGLAHLQSIAQRHGGQCLSREYTGMTSRYRFRCVKGHEWETRADNLRRETWCPVCSSERMSQLRRLTDGLQRLQVAARRKGGVCLSTEYFSTLHFYRFRCKENHEWVASGAQIFVGRWCRLCAIEEKRLGIARMQEVAHERGGQCLSTVYLNSSTKLQWMCHRGHAWFASPSNVVLHGTWCPDCANMARITNSKSKARLRYKASYRHNVDAVSQWETAASMREVEDASALAGALLDDHAEGIEDADEMDFS